MKPRGIALALAAALALALVPPAPTARAAGAPSRASGPARITASAAPTAPAASPASSGGVYSAIGCGLGIRVCMMGGGALPPVVLLTLALCAHMIVDALSKPD